MAAKMSRREMLGLAAATIGGVTALSAGAQTGTGEHPEHARPEAGAPHPEPERPSWEESYSGGLVTVTPLPPGRPGKDYRPVVVPTGYTLPWKIVGGVKVFHLIAAEVDHAFDAGLRATCWAYNGHVNSTVIEAVEGQRVRIYATKAEIMPMPPNSIPMKGAIGPFGDYISMGGMFTIIKVRDRLESYEKDTGWYQHPRGTVALKASAGDLARDGIDIHAQTPRAVDSAPRGSAPRVHSPGEPGHTH